MRLDVGVGVDHDNKGMVGVPSPDRQDLRQALDFEHHVVSPPCPSLALALPSLPRQPARPSFVMATAPIVKNHAIPPPTVGTPAVAATVVDKGALVYYEKLRKELREMIQRKRVLEKNLVCVSLDLSFYDLGQ